MSARPLTLYIGEDGQMWAQDEEAGVAYQLVPSTRAQRFPAPPSNGSGGGGGGGVPEAPTDGQLYGRENAAWAPVPTGGGGADPTKVLKAGDTMTGTLLFSGDQFDGTIAPTPIAGFAIQSSQNGPSGFELADFGGLQLTGPRRHLIFRPNGGIDLWTTNGDRMTIATDGGPMSIQFVPSGGNGPTLACDPSTGDLLVTSNGTAPGIQITSGVSGMQTRLHIDANGDLVATSKTGPNAGKSVNLTVGHWA